MPGSTTLRRKRGTIRDAQSCALTSDGKKLYTANGPSNDVSVVDTDKLQVIGTVPAGKIPWGVAIGRRP